MGALVGTGGGGRRDRSAADAVPITPATASAPADENRNRFMLYPPVRRRATTYSNMQRCLVMFRRLIIVMPHRIEFIYLNIRNLSPQQCHFRVRLNSDISDGDTY